MSRTRILSLIAILSLAVACNTGTSTTTPVPGADTTDIAADAGDDKLWELWSPDAAPDVPGEVPGALDAFDAVSACEPGEGCFGDPCDDNKDCLSGWCVDHLGGTVCTDTCQEECPPGWSCKQAGTDPDVVWVCVSDLPSLCVPCATNTDCVSLTGVQSPCLDYGDEGAFCGGACAGEEDCPEGFACQEAGTVSGATLMQCVSVSGTCECTAKSVSLGLSTPCEEQNEFGTCGGHRVCTADGLGPCDAGAPAAEVCDGLDDDCDGQIDEETCDDDNPCTADACLGAAGCDHVPLEGGECADGNPCTAADHCVAGSCVGDPVICEDQNPCTDDSCTATGGCDHVPNAADCDDGDPCTVADECGDGACAGTPVACDCVQDADCQVLEDEDLCNGTLICDTTSLPYACVVDPATVIDCPEPAGGPDEVCLKAACDAETGACGFAPDHEGAPCEDGDACTFGDLCEEGSCVPGAPLACQDGNPCTDDGCEPASGCSHTPNTAACDDGNPCTAGDVCADGACGGGGAVSCDDGDPCTTDTCDSSGAGCVHTLNADPCDDGDLCTTGDHCHLGSCIAGGVLSCDDGNVCTDDACEALSGCVFTANASACDDGNPCSLGDHCAGGWCVPDAFNACDDGNPCTDDSCDPVGGCIHGNNSAPCDDGDACTTVDLCAAGVCVGVGAPDCDDGDVCTDDACDPALGCLSVPNAAPCDDGDVCTVTDVCAGGLCTGSGALACDDGDVCTTDSCDPATGCQFDAVFPCCGNDLVEPPETCDDGNQVPGDGCDASCQDELGGCVKLGLDVRTLEEPPENWQIGAGGCTSAYCEDSAVVIPMGWHIATEAELIHLTPLVAFGACAAYGICGCYWYGQGTKLTGCDSLHYTCPNGGCTAYTTHCYTQVLLIRDGKDGTCHTGG
jgi:cysteine-rich repeat protein